MPSANKRKPEQGVGGSAGLQGRVGRRCYLCTYEHTSHNQELLPLWP